MSIADKLNAEIAERERVDSDDAYLLAWWNRKTRASKTSMSDDLRRRLRRANRRALQRARKFRAEVIP